MAKRRLLIACGVLAVLAVAVGVYLIVAERSGSCTVGFSGTAVNLTANGEGSEAACKVLAEGALPGTHRFSLHVAPIGDVACVGQMPVWIAANGSEERILVTVTVRDTGLHLLGNEACLGFARPAP